jgi:hypothetical protein
MEKSHFKQQSPIKEASEKSHLTIPQPDEISQSGAIVTVHN